MELSDLPVLPKHIAIILDGNGRWAKKRFLPRGAGHRAGAQNLKKLSERINGSGITHLTVYAFSTENWQRPTNEVDDLMNLLREYIQQYIDDVKKNNMRIRAIGDINALDADLKAKITYLQGATQFNAGLVLTIAINYGGRDEIVRAARRLVDLAARGLMTQERVTEELFMRNLDTNDLPSVDLMIRTGGEQRLSNFLLYQLAYAELYFCETLWPDFSYDNLVEAANWFANRKRKFGNIE